MKQFDVIVIGGGHAGVEAALAAARMGASTALLTFRKEDLGVMSCNPAIGGLGKGHLVREIDAFDGVMARAADYSGIQFRLLNRSRGPAVQGPRTQADRARYRHCIASHCAGQPNLTIIPGEVVDLRMSGADVVGVLLADGTEIASRATVLTTGTFLRGEIHIGADRYPAGRQGAQAATKLADRLAEAAFRIGRLKTGTPARLSSKTINWEQVGRQEADENPVMLSFLNKGPQAPQIICGVTETNSATHEIIRENLHLSAMRSGNITGIGPRYCPSVEDKVTRFADKSAHNVFLEPEGLDDDTVYPNGISTSLPREVQERFLRTIKGLKDVKILQFGYAIEYDYVDPRSLNECLECIEIKGLFLAGQINGTTGYEEAAAQGLVAGLNAAATSLDRPQLVLSRASSYIGVMIDDLTSRGVTEPYRMFSSRAEYRLHLRADNADQRLTPIALQAGCVSPERADFFERKMARLSALRAELEAEVWTPGELQKAGINVRSDGSKRSLYGVLSLNTVTEADLVRLRPALAACEDDDLVQLKTEALYAPYVERQSSEVAALMRDEAVSIPEGFEFDCLSSLSSELKQKLKASRPRSLAQAGRIEGMTPAALVLLLSQLSRNKGSVHDR